MTTLALKVSGLRVRARRVLGLLDVRLLHVRHNFKKVREDVEEA